MVGWLGSGLVGGMGAWVHSSVSKCLGSKSDGSVSNGLK